MPSLSAAELASALALVGVVIMIAALLSGLVERSSVPQVAIFLALGAALGPAGLAALTVELDSAALQIAATLSLALILFTDALSLDLREAREHRTLVLLAIGPGTVLSAALFAAAAWCSACRRPRPRFGRGTRVDRSRAAQGPAAASRDRTSGRVPGRHANCCAADGTGRAH